MGVGKAGQSIKCAFNFKHQHQADKDGNEDLDRDEFVKLYEEYFLVPIQDNEGKAGQRDSSLWS